jgi:SAM-dependent methyltransferase
MNCRACGGMTDPVFEMAPMPLAGAFAETMEAAEEATRYPLTWAACRRCGLVNVWPDIDDGILFRQYAYRASDVPALVRHHRAYAAVLRGHFPERIRVLEIGCNDGVLLRELPETWDRVGVDPSDVAAAAVTDWTLVPERFSSSLARQLGRFDLVTASNTFAHFTAISDGIDGIAAALAPGGLAVIEVHDLDATLRLGQWSIDSLAAAFAIHGLRLTGANRLDLHGGLIRAWFVKSSPFLGDPGKARDYGPLRLAYERRRDVPAYAEMMRGGSAYGAAGRATVYLNQVADLPLGYIVDASPRRIGRYVPGVGLAVVSPEHFDASPPRAALITAWNHARDIRERHPGYDRWVSAW